MTHQKDDMDTASKPDAAPAGDERAMFEKWARQFAHKPDLRTDEGQHEHWLYLSAEVHGWWEAWQARASSAAPAGGAVETLRELVAVKDLGKRMASMHEGKLDEFQALNAEYTRRRPAAWAAARAALAAAPVVPPSILGASPCGGPGSAASRPEPQSVSALRAPIPGAEGDLSTLPEHTASADCWCGPEVDYVDPMGA